MKMTSKQRTQSLSFLNEFPRDFNFRLHEKRTTNDTKH